MRTVQRLTQNPLHPSLTGASPACWPNLPALLLLVSMLCITAAGCTMCQNPYDWSGPVRSGPYASGTTRATPLDGAAYAAAQSPARGAAAMQHETMFTAAGGVQNSVQGGVAPNR